jgi:hypothetical protein
MSDYILSEWITKEEDVKEINLYLYELMTELYSDMSDLNDDDNRGYNIV